MNPPWVSSSVIGHELPRLRTRGVSHAKGRQRSEPSQWGCLVGSQDCRVKGFCEAKCFPNGALGGGFKYCLFSSLFGEDSHFD